MSPEHSLPLPDYERTNASPHFIAVIAGLLALGMAVSLAVSAWLYWVRYSSGPATTAKQQEEESFQHGPDAKTNIARDWAEQDRLVSGHLQHYAWIDRQKGVVQIPIERAMDLIADGAGDQATGEKP